MISKWKVNLVGLTAEHNNGTKIQFFPATIEKEGDWRVISGNYDAETLKEGITCFNHEYAKKVLKTYLGEYCLSVDELILIANKYIDMKDYKARITKEEIESYLMDKAYFPLNSISIIRAAIFFYRKNNS